MGNSRPWPQISLDNSVANVYLNPMPTLSTFRPRANPIRWIWLGMTFLLMAPFVVLAGTFGLFIGLFRGLIRIHCFRMEVFGGILNASIRVTQIVLPFSSRIYEALLARKLYEVRGIPKLTKDFLVVGHRGAPGLFPENTLPSFQAALAQGANALEIDLCLTSDGEVIVWHDWDPNCMVSNFREGGLEAFQAFRPDFGGPTHRKKTSQLSLKEIREHFTLVPLQGAPSQPKPYILTFREFMEWAVTQNLLRAVFLDIKLPPDEPECVKPFIQVLQNVLDDTCPPFECPALTIYPEVYQAMKANAPGLTYCLDVELTNVLMGGDRATIDASSAVRQAELLGNRYASVGRPTFMLLAPWEIYRAVVEHDLGYRDEHLHGLKFISWTINLPEEQKWLLHAGVDGILTDQPGQLAKLALRSKAKQFIKTPFKILKGKRHLDGNPKTPPLQRPL